jgi:glycosyltransferase involved in cell wall biosynthesis
MSKPLVSFVVPCFNYGRFLGCGLQSIFDQEGNYDFEVIVIDDGSTDETQEVVREFAGPNLRLITHRTNEGHINSFNEGLAAARGDFIARMDADDRYRPIFLAATMEKFAAFPKVGLVYGDVAVIDEKGIVTAERCDRFHGDRDFCGNELIPLLEQNFICNASVIARREAWSKVHIPHEAVFEDDWYYKLIIARDYDFYYVDRVVAEYRVHAANNHVSVVRDGREERSVRWLLDLMFGLPEKSPELEREKWRRRRWIYAKHYLTLGDKYFFETMEADARRCYLQALQLRPDFVADAGLLRRLFGTLVGRTTYEWSKRMARSFMKTAENSLAP